MEDNTGAKARMKGDYKDVVVNATVKLPPGTRFTIVKDGVCYVQLKPEGLPEGWEVVLSVPTFMTELE